MRGQAVILDSDLAALYGVTTKRLNEQVRRNKERFPENFMFQLTASEWDSLRSQFATAFTVSMRSQIATASKRNIRYRSYAFTEHGAIMAATILNSRQAIQMSIIVVTAFVRLRRMALSVEGLARKVLEIEKKYDRQFKVVFDAVRQLMSPPEPPRKRIGFNAG
ncbi:MAG: ORF6N domain-containing protein [Kiritimatiellia bacterium]